MASVSTVILIGIEEGAKYLPTFVGAAIVFRLAHFPDFGVAGSFSLGACVCAALSATGVPPTIAVLSGVIASALAGALTSGLYILSRLHSLLCGIVTAGIAYSLCYWILGGANLPVKPFASEATGGMVGIGIALLVIFVMSTRYGLQARIAGERPELVRTHRGHPGRWIMILLIFGNGFVGLGGCMVAGIEGQARADMGRELLFLLITAMLIGEGIMAALVFVLFTLFKKTNNIQRIHLLSVISGAGSAMIVIGACVGAVIYRVIHVATFQIFGASDWTLGILAIGTAMLMFFIGRVGRIRRMLPPWTFHGLYSHA